MATGKSIHIGLNFVDSAAYDGWDGKLSGCVNDANALKGIADSLGYSSTIITNSQATSYRVIQEIVGAANTLKAGDVLLLTYSGHGGQVPDANSDEADAKDETWVLYDRELVDDELYALWSQFTPGVRIVLLSDSCHSGTVLKDRFAGQIPIARKARRARAREIERLETPAQHQSKDNVPRDVAISAQPTAEEESWEDKPKYLPRDVQERINRRDRPMYNTLQWIAGPARSAKIGASILLISGCQDNQYSYDGGYYGQFTGTLLQVWDNGAFQGDYRSFHKNIHNLMPPEQSPNYATAGTPNLAFEQQKPFTIAPSQGQPGMGPTPSVTPEPSKRTLSQGDTGDDVRYLQQRLQDLGYSIVVDGYFGRQTTARVEEFQGANGLTIDGIVGPTTWAALEQSQQPTPSQPGTPSPVAPESGSPTPVSTTRPQLKRGDKNEHVRYLQQLLTNHGYYLNIDGVFGPKTESCVRDFQRSQGLVADGIVGPQTWNVLESGTW